MSHSESSTFGLIIGWSSIEVVLMCWLTKRVAGELSLRKYARWEGGINVALEYSRCFLETWDEDA